jgi:hypothetical protein
MTAETIDDIIEAIRLHRPSVIIFDTMNDYLDQWANSPQIRSSYRRLKRFEGVWPTFPLGRTAGRSDTNGLSTPPAPGPFFLCITTAPTLPCPIHHTFTKEFYDAPSNWDSDDD